MEGVGPLNASLPFHFAVLPPNYYLVASLSVTIHGCRQALFMAHQAKYRRLAEGIDNGEPTDGKNHRRQGLFLGMFGKATRPISAAAAKPQMTTAAGTTPSDSVNKITTSLGDTTTTTTTTTPQTFGDSSRPFSTKQRTGRMCRFMHQFNLHHQRVSG